MGLSALPLAGCALWNAHGPTAPEPLAFLTQALEADDAARESLWKSAAQAGDSDDSALRTALLQSLSGHSGYDPAAAHQALAQLAKDGAAPRQVSAVARLRLAQVNDTAACSTEVIQLRQRLARVVDIEKRLNQKGH